MRVKRIGLEHHGYTTVGRLDIIDDAIADAHLAATNILQARDHAQQSRLAAARWADENNELTRGDLDIDTLDYFYRAVALND